MKTRYLLIWTPWRKVLDAARKRGMDHEGHQSALDYVDADEFEIHEVFPSFTAALSIGRGKRGTDMWKEPRIYEQRDCGFGWDAVRFWEITPGVKKSDAIEVQ